LIAVETLRSLRAFPSPAESFIQGTLIMEGVEDHDRTHGFDQKRPSRAAAPLLP